MSDTSPVSNPASPPGSPTLLGDKQDNSKDGSDCGTKFELFCARTLDLSRQIVDTDDLRAVVHGWDNDKCYDQICTLLRAYYKYHETVRDLTEEARKEGRAEQSEKIETLTVQLTAAQNASSPTDTKKIEALEKDLQSSNDSCKTHANKNTTLEAELTAEKAKVTAARNASSPTDTKKIEALEQDLQSLNDSCKTHANKNTTLEAELTAEKAKVTAAQNASSPTDTKKIEALEKDLHLARSGDLGGNSRHSPDGKLFEEKIFEVLEEIEPTGTVESYRQKAGDTLLADTVVEAKSANQQQRESSYKGDQSSGLPKTARDMIATGRKLGVFVVQHRSIVYLSEKYTNMEVVKVKGMPILLVPNIRHEAVLKDTMAQALRVVRKAATQLTLDRDYFKSQIKTTIESVKAAFSNAEACSHSILCGFRHHEKLLCMGKFTEPTLQFSRQTYGPKIDALFAAVDEVKKEWVVIQQANKRLGGTAAASASTDMIDLTDNLEAPPAKKHKGSSDGLE